MDNKSVSDQSLTPQSPENSKKFPKPKSRRNSEFSKFLENKNLNILGENSPKGDTPKFFANNGNGNGRWIKQSVLGQKSPQARSPQAKDSTGDSEDLPEYNDDALIQANPTG